MSEEHIDDQVDDKTEANETTEVDDKQQAAAETRAREFGWVPKEEWRGDPEDWTDAGEWLEKGDKIMGAQLRRAESKLSDMQAELDRRDADFQTRLDRMDRMHQRREAQMRQQMEEQFEDRVRKAAETGDSDALDAAFRERKADADRLSKEQKEEQGDGEDDKQQQLSRTQREWLEDNAWYEKDATLTRWAKTFADDIEDEMPAASEREKLAEIAKRVREQFPDKFGGTKKRSPVESGSRVFEGGNGEARAGQLFSKMVPPEGKEQFKRDVASGLYKDTKEDRERWAEAYLS